MFLLDSSFIAFIAAGLDEESGGYYYKEYYYE